MNNMPWYSFVSRCHQSAVFNTSDLVISIPKVLKRLISYSTDYAEQYASSLDTNERTRYHVVKPLNVGVVSSSVSVR